MDIQLFNNPQFGNVRTAGTPEEPLFCLADICKAVDLTNPSSVKQRLDPEDTQLIDLHALNGVSFEGNSKATFINESAVYEVILFSGSEKVRPFRRWLTKEVIPSIRKNGGYIQARPDETPEEIMAKAVILANKTIEQQRLRLQALAEDNARKQLLLEEQKPKVLFADAVATAKQSCLIGELAKILKQNGIETGQNRLFDWLRDNGYLGKFGQYYNMPTQRAMELGLFELKKTTVNKPDGSILVTTTTKVTGKGQQYFINKFLGGRV